MKGKNTNKFLTAKLSNLNEKQDIPEEKNMWQGPNLQGNLQFNCESKNAVIKKTLIH